MDWCGANDLVHQHRGAWYSNTDLAYLPKNLCSDCCLEFWLRGCTSFEGPPPTTPSPPPPLPPPTPPCPMRLTCGAGGLLGSGCLPSANPEFSLPQSLKLVPSASTTKNLTPRASGQLQRVPPRPPPRQRTQALWHSQAQRRTTSYSSHGSHSDAAAAAAWAAAACAPLVVLASCCPPAAAPTPPAATAPARCRPSTHRRAQSCRRRSRGPCSSACGPTAAAASASTCAHTHRRE
eukprot:COSAG01_NODE_1417_length_10376_cov_8.765009_7_plen_235_part_00